MEISPEVLQQIVATVATSAATWGAIRADIKGMKERILRNEAESTRLGDRIDNHLETQHNRRKDD